MENVGIKFRAGTSDAKQEEARHEILAASGVEGVVRINAVSWFAEVADAAAAASLIDRLKERVEVEYAGSPPVRGLLAGVPPTGN